MVMLRLILESYDCSLLENTSMVIVSQATDVSQKIKGPVRLPTRLRKYCVLTSPHVNKKAREHFEIRKYKRMIDLIEPRDEFMVNLLKLRIPAGVGVKFIGKRRQRKRYSSL